MADSSAQRWYGSATARRISTIYRRLAEHIVPQSDLSYDDPFQMLVAVVLSAQATDKSVNQALANLYPVAGTPRAILALGVDGLIPYIRTIGLYNAKARNVIALCQQLLDEHDGQVPPQRAALEALPGVGRKTANVILNICFGEPTIAVDTHVHRVANRLGITATSTVEQSERVLLERTPKRYLLNAHHYLILHGRYRCTARAPRCDDCPLRTLCPSRQD
ncbi:MAG: endonuclease III [Planctomycetota bacterium]|jgi:endonuclease-3